MKTIQLYEYNELSEEAKLYAKENTDKNAEIQRFIGVAIEHIDSWYNEVISELKAENIDDKDDLIKALDKIGSYISEELKDRLEAGEYILDIYEEIEDMRQLEISQIYDDTMGYLQEWGLYTFYFDINGKYITFENI